MIGLLRRLFGDGRPQQLPAAWVTTLPMGERDHILQTVGEASYQPALRWACNGTNAEGPNNPRVLAELVPEPSNRYDMNAVKVQVSGRCVGYLSRTDAARYLPVLLQLATGGPLTCEARIKGGYALQDEPGFRAHLGIELFVASHKELATVTAHEAPTATE